jgi:hypothetical protein
MSRLKGADLGVSVPSAALNFRGDWVSAPNPAYALNDVVIRNGVAYSANAVPGATDPAAGAVSNLGASTPTTSLSGTGSRNAQGFTVSAPVSVRAVKVWCRGAAGTFAGGQTVGIATSLGGGTPVYLTQGTTTATASAGPQTVLMPVATLLPGTQYYVVSEELQVEDGNGAADSGVVTTTGNQTFGATLGNNVGAGYRLHFELDTEVWKALAPSGVSSDANNNTKAGASALAALTTGSGNTAFGKNALSAITTGVNQTAVGTDALLALTTGVRNTAVGSSALKANQAGNDATALGYNALQTSTGNGNTALGSQAATNLGGGTQNTAVGALALSAASNPTGATAVGYQAMGSATAAGTAVGYQALQNATGGSNTAVGFMALQANTTGANNTAVGNSALAANTIGGTNIAVGTSALAQLVSGSQNVAVGHQALNSSTTGGNNVAVGALAAKLATASSTTAVGFQALTNLTSGANNVAVGSNALRDNVTGTDNVAVGPSALLKNLASDNTGIGSLAGGNITSGGDNTVIGYNAALALTTGTSSTAVGSGALAAATTSSYNTAVGFQSLGSATGTNNTALGKWAGANVISGHDNVHIGANAYPLSGGAGPAQVGVVQIGASTVTDNSYTTALGYTTKAQALGATAIGVDSTGLGAVTSTQDEMKLGTGLTTVYAGKDIRTAQPSANGAGKWQLGKVIAAASALDTANYLEVLVDGVVKKVALVT